MLKMLSLAGKKSIDRSSENLSGFLSTHFLGSLAVHCPLEAVYFLSLDESDAQSSGHWGRQSPLSPSEAAPE